MQNLLLSSKYLIKIYFTKKSKYFPRPFRLNCHRVKLVYCIRILVPEKRNILQEQLFKCTKHKLLKPSMAPLGFKHCSCGLVLSVIKADY